MAEAVIVDAVRHRSASATAACRACIPPTCPPRCSTPSPSAPASTPRIVDDVIWGCVMQVGEQSLDIGRTALLAAGWPETVPGTTVDRQCGSSQQSVHFAAAGVVAGHYDVVVAGGVESMTRTPMGASLADGGHPYPRGVPRPLQPDPEPGHRRRDDRRPVGLRPHRGRRVLARLAREGRRRTGFRCVRRPDRRDQGPGRQPGAQGRGHPPRHHHREDRRAQAGVQGGRRDPRRQLVADLRRLGRAADHVGREGQVAGAQATCQGAHRDAGRRRPGDHADRPDPRHAEGAQALGPASSRTSACSRSTRRSRRCRWPG